MREAVVAKVIAEGAFGQRAAGFDGAGDAEIGLGVDGHGAGSRRLAAGGIIDQRNAMARQCAGEGQFADAFGQRHDGGQGHGGRAADEDIHAQGLAAPQGGRVVHADAAVNLVVHADFFVRPVLAAGDLNAIDAEVGMAPAWVVGIFGVHSGQGNEGAAVVGPAFELR